MNCEYCNNPCKSDDKWWECHHCGVSYENSELYGHHIKFERHTEDWAYALNLYPQSQLTVLTGFHRDFGTTKPWDRCHLEMKIPYLLQNVNQHNVMDKIKFLLLFQ